MISKSPSGALSPYYYKGGYFHGIHYGSFHDDMDALRSMMAAEEEYILRSAEKRRIIIDFYETNLTEAAISEFVAHVERLNTRIFKMTISCDPKMIKAIRRALLKGCSLPKGLMYFTPDMEEGKTWLVSDQG